MDPQAPGPGAVPEAPRERPVARLLARLRRRRAVYAVGAGVVGAAVLAGAALAVAFSGPPKKGASSLVVASPSETSASFGTPAPAQTVGTTPTVAAGSSVAGQPSPAATATGGTPGRIEALVLGASGRPVPGAYVAQHYDHGPLDGVTRYSLSADGAGRVDLDCHGYPAGVLYASGPPEDFSPDGGGTAVPYTCGTSVVLRLPPAGSIVGNAGCSRQFPPFGIGVRLVRGAPDLLLFADATYTTSLGPQGQLRIVGLAAGVYDLMAEPVGYRGEATVVAGRVTTVSLGTNDCTSPATPGETQTAPQTSPPPVSGEPSSPATTTTTATTTASSHQEPAMSRSPRSLARAACPRMLRAIDDSCSAARRS